MSRDYFLICCTCRCYLSFGKVYWLDEDGSLLDQVTFQGIYWPSDGQSHKRDEVFGRVIEKFLILHRNHKLTFAPEGVDEILELHGGPVNPVEADEIIAAPVEPPVKWEEEREKWRELKGRN